MSNATIKIESTGLEEMFRFYGAVKQKTLPDTLRIHARILCVELARRTQPFGDKSGGEKIGEKAIAKDIYGGRRSSGKGKGRAGLFANLRRSQEVYHDVVGESEFIEIFKTKNGEIYGTDKAHFLPGASVSDIADIHRANFVNGRMSAAGGDTRNIGRWKFVNKYFVPPSALQAFAASQYRKVGLAKSGWAWCAKHLKNPVKGSATRGIPKWVTRHLGDYGLGQVEDNADDKNNPRITLTNTSKYADKVCRESERNVAVVIVVEKMVKQLANILRYERKKLQKAS
jgi:hypothetical protein